MGWEVESTASNYYIHKAVSRVGNFYAIIPALRDGMPYIVTFRFDNPKEAKEQISEHVDLETGELEWTYPWTKDLWRVVNKINRDLDKIFPKENYVSVAEEHRWLLNRGKNRYGGRNRGKYAYDLGYELFKKEKDILSTILTSKCCNKSAEYYNHIAYDEVIYKCTECGKRYKINHKDIQK